MACIHSSTNAAANNIALAWLGDTALNLIATEQLVGAAGFAPDPGRLSGLRSQLVCRAACLARANNLGMAPYVVVGKSVLGVGADAASVDWALNASVLAEAFEAVLGAAYLDGGLAAAKRIYQASSRLFPPLPARPPVSPESAAAQGEAGGAAPATSGKLAKGKAKAKPKGKAQPAESVESGAGGAATAGGAHAQGIGHDASASGVAQPKKNATAKAGSGSKAKPKGNPKPKENSKAKS